ncbi:response regulator [Pseudomonas sp. F1_0610]|uniref:GGDEF domain-containing response regulator n=1 Tax=Pseudomonas sp. F1_0610 TaxID=3114284 RepID=UPI0039C48597
MDEILPKNLQDQQTTMLQIAHLTRDVITVWQQFHQTGYENVFASLMATLKNFEFSVQHSTIHSQLTQKIIAELRQLKAIYATLDKSLLEPIDALMFNLEQEAIKQFGERNQLLETSGFIEQPIYVLCQTEALVEKLSSHLVYLARRVIAFDSAEVLLQASTKELPVAVVLIVDAKLSTTDLDALNEFHKENKQLPIFMLSFEPNRDVAFRLEVVRRQYTGFFSGISDESYFLSSLERYVHNRKSTAYRILIIDDSRAQALLLQRMLEDHTQFKVDTTNEPYEALNKLADFKPDVILLDMQMPECFGYELASVIRQSCRYTGTQILYMSAEEELDKRILTLTEDADGFIVKPVKAHHLQKQIMCKALRGRNIMRQLSKDAYTQLDNREYFIFAAEDQIRQATLGLYTLSFAVLGIDHLRYFNQRYGYSAGDQLLKGFVLFLKQNLTEVTIGRYSGNKIVLIFKQKTSVEVKAILDTLLKAYSILVYDLANEKVFASFSAAIVAWQEGYEVQEVITKAAQAISRTAKLSYAQIDIIE